MPKNMLITKADMTKLLANGEKSRQGSHDPKPVIKLFNPCGADTWLLSEIDPEDHDRAFGLCDLGMGSPELGYVSLTEIRSVRLRFGLGIERDRWFTADKPISQYADEARELGRINV